MTLAINNLKSAPGSRRNRKKIGRGNASGHGNYSGRGGKGQTARSGGQRGLKLRSFKRQMQATPKLGGFKSKFERPAEVYLADLEAKFNNGEKVNLESLAAKKLIRADARIAKILSSGQLTKKLTVEGVRCTKTAAEAIKKMGGEVK